MTGRATAWAPANIAFIKYWGNRDAVLRIPWNSSLSMNLSEAAAVTTVEFDPALTGDVVILNGSAASKQARARVSAHLDRIRAMASLSAHAQVTSATTFPVGTGIASSAAGFAALSLAGTSAAGLNLGQSELSRLARLGSGSAARSIPAGFVEWHAGTDDLSSYAVSLAPPDHWDLVDLVAVVDTSPKDVPSTDGHDAAGASPLFPCRLEGVARRLDEVRGALLARDFATFGPLVEEEALSLHAVAMTGRPGILYLTGGTMDVLHAVRAWRKQGAQVVFTLDAGPNVHVLCEGRSLDDIRARLEAMPVVSKVLVNHPAGGARLLV